MPDEEDPTTPDTPNAWKQVFEQLDRLEQLVQHVVDNELIRNVAYARLESTQLSQDKRLLWLEQRSSWIPMSFSALSLVCSVATLIWCLTFRMR